MPENCFHPGDRVRVVLGADISLAGEVVSLFDACVLWMNLGPAAPTFWNSPGQVCVAVTIFGKRIPLAFDAKQLELEAHVYLMRAAG